MIKIAVLGNETPDEIRLWISALKTVSEQINFFIIDLTRNDWFEKVTSVEYDFFLCKPPGLNARFKQLYDERIYVIADVLKLPIYPTLTEVLFYENKRFLSAWLKANKLPHPETFVFYNENEALRFADNTILPIVAKVNIGASGSGVKILKKKDDIEKYIEGAFSVGISQRWGPNLQKGHLFKRGLHYLFKPQDIKKKTTVYKKKRQDVQKGFVLFQEYVEHDFEWRIVAIGDSYFAHKKLKIGEKASGSTLKQYDNPPLKLFNFAKNIMDRFGFYSQAIDLFETKDGKFLINEMQCIFGQSDPYQMLINGKPGRYRFVNGKWLFEEGRFNGNESYDLRVEHVLKLMNDR